MPVKDPAFKKAGEKAGIEIWRIENFAPVKVDQAEYGIFYLGDCYIILSTSCDRRGSGRKLELFYWLGPECSTDEKGTCAIKATELDDSLDGAPVQHREVGRHESKIFISLFKKGITHKKGGIKSGFRHVEEKFEKQLYQVKGKRHPVLSSVPVSAGSLNNGDSFILDCGPKIYVFNGTYVRKEEKTEALKSAIKIRDNERGGSAVLKVIDAKFKRQVRTSVQLEQDEDTLKFFEELGCNKVHEIRSAEEGGTDEEADKAEVRLYRTKEEDGKVTMKEEGGKPLKRSMLDSDDAFILEAAKQIFVWIGRHASRSEKVEAMKKAEGFISAKNLPAHTPISVFREKLEPVLFTSFFSDWDPVIIPTQKSASRIAKVQQTKFDVTKMHEAIARKEAKMLDDGSGEKQIYRVKHFDLEVVPKEKHGIFYSGDCYVLLYTYSNRGRESYVVYYWIGNESSKDEQGTAALKAIEIDDKLGGIALQVRVVEDKEPPHFLQLFENKMIVYQGGHHTGFKNVSAAAQGAPEGIKLFQIHVSDNEFRAVEVAARTASLNSSDAFVLDIRSLVYVWCGKGCAGDEREFAKEVAGLVNPRGKKDYQLYMEGKEPEDFWDALGGKGPYSSSKIPKEVLEEHPPRLFHCSNATGNFKVEEVPNFEQEDMYEDDVMILDLFAEIYVWQGKDSNRKERELSEVAAMEYLDSDPRGKRSSAPIYITKQGCEPTSFTMHFMPWDPDFWRKKIPYSSLLEQVESENAERASVVQRKISIASNSPKKTCTLNELRKPAEQLPLFVDATKKEQHLSDADFEALFNMKKEEYLAMPAWKQNQEKKKHDLY